MILFTSGCSYTYGEELEDRQYAWPFVLGKLLNCSVVNRGICSGSNSYIVRTTMEFMSRVISDNISTSDVIVVLGFTTENRKECWSDYYKKYMQTKIGREFGLVDKSIPRIIPYNIVEGHKSIKKVLDSIIDKYLNTFESNEYFNMNSKMIQMITMHFYLKSMGVKHLFFDSMSNCELKVKDNGTEVVESYITLKNLFDLVFINNKHYVSEFTMSKFCNSYPKARQKHPLEEGHEAWAKLLYERAVELGFVDGQH